MFIRFAGCRHIGAQSTRHRRPEEGNDARVLAVAALVTSSVFAPGIGAAHADPPSVVGRTCGFTSSDDPTGTLADPGTQIGEIHGGPIVVADLPSIDTTTTPPTVGAADPTGNPAWATIICEIQVNGTGVYTDPDVVSASAAWTRVVDLPPTTISYRLGPTDSVYVCTTWVVGDANGDVAVLLRGRHHPHADGRPQHGEMRTIDEQHSRL